MLRSFKTQGTKTKTILTLQLLVSLVLFLWEVLNSADQTMFQDPNRL